MNYTATVRKHPDSRFWAAVYYRFNKKSGGWERKEESTRVSRKSEAQGIADKLQEVALRAAGVDAARPITREYVFELVNTILRVAGHAPVEETRRWDEYSKEVLDLYKGKMGEDSRTYEAYKGHVKKVNDWLGEDRTQALNLFTGPECQTWYDDMIDEGRRPKTVNNAVKFLQTLFDRAIAEGVCVRNPITLIFRKYGESNERAPFSVEDLTKIFAFLNNPKPIQGITEGQMKDWLTVALTGYCAGQRLTDCATLAETFLEKSKTEPWIWQTDQGKTGNEVRIPIVEPLASHLRKITAQSGRTSVYLAPHLSELPTGGHNGLSMQFSLILDAAGVERVTTEKTAGSKGRRWTDKTFHSFRHTCNSLLANAGVSQEIRMKILGHKSAAVNTIYTHHDMELLHVALEQAVKRGSGAK